METALWVTEQPQGLGWLGLGFRLKAYALNVGVESLGNLGY